jgi:hypothetical protein
VPFEFFDNTDLNVYINDTLQTLTTHYTVTGGSGSTGSITLVTGATAGDIVVITRDVTLERTTDFPTSGPFQVASLNTELDKVVAMIADMKDLAERGLRLSDSDTTTSLTLASKDTRKGTVLAFNETTGAVEVGPTIADTNTIAQIKADIATLADIQDGTVATNAITIVSSIAPNVTTVAGISSQVTTVAGQTTNLQNVTDNLTDIQNAATNATNAAASATAAASSATAAATSETNAGTSETNAATSATNASNSASAASTSASAASTSATAAASSATAAATSETNAGTSETNAATSATNAATSATNAGTSETNAASSATAAAASATSASNAQTAAESARDSALASFDSFDDRYLGTKTSDPTVDNDGDALVAGALYFNSTDGEMKVYNGTSWVDAYADGASLVAKSGDTMTGNLSFGDNNKAIFGAGSDLEIFSDGTKGRINGDFDMGGLPRITATGYPILRIQPGSSTNPARIQFGLSGDEDHGEIEYVNSTGIMTLRANDTDSFSVSGDGAFIGPSYSSPSSLADEFIINNPSGHCGMTIASGSNYIGNIYFADPASGTPGRIFYAHAADYMSFQTAGSEDMRLTATGDLHVDGNVIAYSTTISDIRLKKDIAPIEDAVTKVQQLNGCTFTYLKDDRKSAGLIAQDVEKVLPSAVIEDKAVFHGEEGETYKTVQYDQLIGLLVEAVKELKAEIEELKDASSK